MNAVTATLELHELSVVDAAQVLGGEDGFWGRLGVYLIKFTAEHWSEALEGYRDGMAACGCGG